MIHIQVFRTINKYVHYRIKRGKKGAVGGSGRNYISLKVIVTVYKKEYVIILANIKFTR